MADAAALAGRSSTVGTPTDAAQDCAQAARRERTVASNFEVVELARDYRVHVLQRERIRSDVVNNLANVYDELRKIVMTQRPDADGWHVATIPQLRGRIYDDHKQTEGREQSIRAWLQELERALCVIDLEQATVGAGKSIGFRFRLRPESAWWSVPCEARRSSSAGQAATCGVRRRPESRRQRERRRVAPYRRRTGHGGVGRYVVDPAGGTPEQGVSFLSSLSPRPGASPFPPTGERRSREADAGTRAGEGARRPSANPSADDASGPPWWVAAASAVAWPPPRRMSDGSDALHRALHPNDRAALDGLWCLGIEGGGIEAVVAAGRTGAPPAAVLLALWALACPGREPRLSLANRAQLERSWCQLDRCHGPGAAAAALGQLFGDVHNGVDRFDGELHTAAWAVMRLKAAARAARRRERGAPPPRRWRPRGAL